ncbi:hypothetical protein B0H11DRAFT_2236056 [Mycena galericulata]|nr:hypothetical protein B0H11DRAFT_2236056 [Mycena galericulata]
MVARTSLFGAAYTELAVMGIPMSFKYRPGNAAGVPLLSPDACPYDPIQQAGTPKRATGASSALFFFRMLYMALIRADCIGYARVATLRWCVGILQRSSVSSPCMGICILHLAGQRRHENSDLYEKTDKRSVKRYSSHRRIPVANVAMLKPI